MSQNYYFCTAIILINTSYLQMKISFNFKLLVFYLIGALTLLESCVPDTSGKTTEININLSDVEIQNIYNLQDKLDVIALYKYLRSDNPSHRYLSALALGSVKDESSVDSLIVLLKDPIMEIRTAAAYSIGQIGDIKSATRLIASFKNKDTIDINNLFNCQILEAVGKTGILKDLNNMANVKTYRSTDTLLLLGQARAIYRMALRNIVSDDGTSRMVDLLYQEKIPHEIRLLAAHYLARAKDISLNNSSIRLTDLFSKERNPDIRMALATSFGKNRDSLFLPVLKTALSTEKDYRVQTNIIRAISQYPYFEMRDILLPYLKNENIHISSTAAQGFLANGFIEDVPLYMQYDNDSIPWQVRAPMCGAVLAHTALYFTNSKQATTAKIINNLKKENNVYGKVAYIHALAKDPFNYGVLMNLSAENQDKLLKAAALEGLGDILKNPLFYKAFGNNFGRVKSEIFGALVGGISSEDVAQISMASNILKDEKLQWNFWVKDFNFMEEALNKLKLPKDIETYNDLASCIAFLKNEKYTPKKPEFNNPINWELLNTKIGDSSIAAIKTTQGLIRVQLFKKSAPATVANFVKLIEDKFYNGKVFHRVVPNFVIQTGCPRGDGFGSLDNTIRSELPIQYFDKAGYLGMASAGNHTESTQWFITHSPTPHLDGNYTLFGKVIEGMDVVHKISQGDKINEIIFVK